MSPEHPHTERLRQRLAERPMRQDLEPVRREVRSRFGNVGWRTAQVVGSNGKGSWVHYASRLLAGPHRTVVSYTSPHFLHPSERIAVDDRSIDPSRLEALLAEEPEELRTGWTPFELLFLAALKVARRREADVVLLEAGMGGRWDATSSLPADWTVLTGVEREHTRFLGETREEILREKLAQVPPGSGLLGPTMEGTCREVLEGIVREKRLDFHAVKGTGDERTRRLAVEYAHRIGGRSRPELTGALRSVRPPRGRRHTGERRGRTVVLDVAHTPAAVGDLVRHLQTTQPDRWWVVYGGLRGKRVRRLLDRLAELADPNRIVPTRAPSPRARGVQELRELHPAGDPPAGFEDPLDAARHVLERSAPGEGILIVGSFPLVARLFEAGWP